MGNNHVCARCNTPVEFSDVSEGYFATCPNHDEDLYEFETRKKIKEYDINLWTDGYGDIKVSAYQMYVDDKGLQNTDTQQYSTYTFTTDDVENLSAIWSELGYTYEFGDPIDDWDVDGAGLNLPAKVKQWISDLPMYELEDLR
jgi:hypothetical protein